MDLDATRLLRRSFVRARDGEASGRTGLEGWRTGSRRSGAAPRGKAGGRDAFVEDAHAAELLVALLQQFVGRHVAQVAEVAEQVRLQGVGHLARVAVGA